MWPFVIGALRGADSGSLFTRPKRRHLVISEFIRACLDEGTLLDEDGKPCVILTSAPVDEFVSCINQEFVP